jgi:hypothetical protein
MSLRDGNAFFQRTGGRFMIARDGETQGGPRMTSIIKKTVEGSAAVR